MMRSAPPSAHAVAAPVLAALDDHLRQTFALRLDRWWDDLNDAVRSVYAGGQAHALAHDLVLRAARAFAERSADLHRLDEARTLEPDWFQSPRMLGYAAYAERFAGDLAGVAKRIPYLRELGVTYLHLMPLLLPRPGDSDGGYAVADYRRVRPDLGTIEDLRELTSALREDGISLVLDLVLNHVAREHDWAVRARAGEERYRDYFHWFADRALPDAYERTLPEVFPDFAPGNFTWDEDLQAWVWTTFNSWQWDVNWANPDVFLEYAELVLFLANQGVEVLRLDAIAFVWKRLGTTSQNQPEVHAITQGLRAVARIAAPALVFKAEAIVAPGDLVHYLGQGHHHGKVSDLAYHNSLMVQIWSALAAGDVRLAAHVLGNLPTAPTTTAWLTYVRCHDDIGWAIVDDDAAAVGLNAFQHRKFLSDYYAGEFFGSPARGLVFQANPQTGDRRISGTTASLAGIEAALDAVAGDEGELDAGAAPDDRDSDDLDSALDSTLDSALDLAIGRALLAHALVMGWGGVPVLWSGDELGLVDDPLWADEPGHAGDNRWAHRPRLPWDVAGQRLDPGSVAGRMFTGIAHLARVRAGTAQLHASVPAEILPLSDPGILPVVRRHPVGNLVGLYNMTATWRPFPAWRLDEFGLGAGLDALSGATPDIGDDGNLWLAPYQALWLIDR